MNKGSIAAKHRIGEILFDGTYVGPKTGNHEKKGMQLIFEAAESGWPRAIEDTATLKTFVHGMEEPEWVKIHTRTLLKNEESEYVYAYVSLYTTLLREKLYEKARQIWTDAWRVTNGESAEIAAVNVGLDEYGYIDREDLRRQLFWANKAYESQQEKRNEWYSGEIFAAMAGYWLNAERGNNFDQAKKWIRRSISEENAGAYVLEGEVYRGVYGNEKNIENAKESLTHAMNLGNAFAMYELGHVLKFHPKKNEDQRRAIELTLMAAKLGVPTAMGNMAIKYYAGIEVGADMERCYFWGRLANKVFLPGELGRQEKAFNKLVKACESKLSVKVTRKLNTDVDSLGSIVIVRQ